MPEPLTLPARCDLALQCSSRSRRAARVSRLRSGSTNTSHNGPPHAPASSDFRGVERDWRGETERDRLRSGCRTEDAARTSSTRTRLKQAPAQEPSMRLYAQQRPVADRLLVMSCRGLIEVSQAAARSQIWKKNDCTNAACKPPAGGNMDDWGERTFAGHRHG